MGERMLARAGVEASALEHLLDSLYRAAALSEVFGSLTAALDAEDGVLVGGELHPFLVEYGHWTERHGRLAKLCLDANIDERRVVIAEQQGMLLAQAVQGILRELGVADRPEVAGIVRKHLTLIAGSS